MTTTVSDFILDRLQGWGVRRLFGYPGDGINGIFGALERAGDRFEFIQARHEETAGLMAVAHAKFSGQLSACVATSGPGAIHLLNALYDAKKDLQPVVAIVGQQARVTHGADQHQEVDLEQVFAGVAGFCQTVLVPEQARMVIDRACRIALERHTPCVVILPNDVQELEAVPMPRRAHGMSRTSDAFSRPVVVPADVDLRAAAEVLNSGERVAMLIGSGARGAEQQVRAIAERLGAGVAKALLGKDVLPDSLPYVTGAIGLLGTKPSWEMMQSCDTLLMVGTSFPYVEFLPEAARAVQVDIDGTRVGMRYPTEVNLVGDSARTLDLLLPLLRERSDRGWLEGIERDVVTWRAECRGQADVEADPINPELVAIAMSDALPDRAIVTADSGTSVSWYARHVELREGMRGSVSGQLASMGVGVPYAIGAKFAHPDRPVVAFLGDGSMQMNGMAELLTVLHYHERWSNQQFVVAVLDNSDLNMVTWEQRVMAGDPRYAASLDLPRADYAAIATAMGLHAERVDDPAEVAGAWQRAFAAGRPAVIDFVVDADVPPMPPHVSFEQAKHLMFALAHGDEDRGGIVRQAVRNVVHR
jgi:pyruvate dehydrogenase (quinone)